MEPIVCKSEISHKKVNSIAIIINNLILPEENDQTTQNTDELDALLEGQITNLKGMGYEVLYLKRYESDAIKDYFKSLQTDLSKRNVKINDVLILVTGFVRNTVIIDYKNATIPMAIIINEFAEQISNYKIHLYLMLTHSPLVADAETTDVANGSAPLNMTDFNSPRYSNYRQHIVRLGNERGAHFYGKLHSRVNYVFFALPIWLGPTENREGFSSDCSFSVIVTWLKDGRKQHSLWSAVAENIRNSMNAFSDQVDGLKPPTVSTGGDNFNL